MLFFKNIPTFLPRADQEKKFWNGLNNGVRFLLLADAIESIKGLSIIICSNTAEAIETESSLSIYLKDKVEILHFPDWETLPYDQFSPHQDLISQRLKTLARLNHKQHAVLICSCTTLMHRLPPKEFIQGNTFALAKQQQINPAEFSDTLINSGYRRSDTVLERGEFAVRGSIIDLFPMGAKDAIRLELFDDEIETLRTFDVENQRTLESLDQINILPAREFPFDNNSIAKFKHAWQSHFDVDYRKCPSYQDVSNNIIPSGIEYYIPLFFDQTSDLFQHLPEEAHIFLFEGFENHCETFWKDAQNRYENLKGDITRPILSPETIFMSKDEFLQNIAPFKRIYCSTAQEKEEVSKGRHCFPSDTLPELSADPKHQKSLYKLEQLISDNPGARILLCAQTPGRKEQLSELLQKNKITAHYLDDIQDFFETQKPACYICVADLHQGFVLKEDDNSHFSHTILVTESEIYGYQVSQERRREQNNKQSADLIIKNLSELAIDAPVVHIDHGVGRYRGLEMLSIDDQEIEFLCLEYAQKAKLYVPVSSLHLISRYSGGADESAPLHSLGSEQWQKARKKAAEKIHDVAAELLDIYARREAVKGNSYKVQEEEYQQFANSFPFEETDDQVNAIKACLEDMKMEKPMDRLICGDVGFGKTEVAMRAAFVAIQNNKQVAVLVPTTLLAEQHGETFKDRFADWPVKIETLSRFQSAKQSKEVLSQLEAGKIDIIVGTHKILQKEIKFKSLGLIIIDEEHRFGVRHKETLKSMRSNVDILTLTATPIPRTLNMAMSGIRDISIIATPPAKRLSIKTFVHTSSSNTIKEAVHRELLRGGQVFYLHNEVSTIEKTASDIQELIPEARISIAHGQMREKQLEKVMSDFYHKQSNILVCTTIIETGIDIPSANTIIIDRADKLGLAQLHQLRGRVGRSHHQAYAYLLTPHHKAMTADAIKRLDAIQEATNLGAGFTLASHDLEIRGAGELLGDEQSGNMHAIGFSLYMEMLEEAVHSIRQGTLPAKDTAFRHGTEINLSLPALIPEDYLPDVHLRLIMYKRISSAKTPQELSELQVEMIDRFGMLPDQVKLLIEVTLIKLKAEHIGIKKIDSGAQRGKIHFTSDTRVEPITIVNLVQQESGHYKMEGADKLQFIFEMEAYGDRIKTVNQVLDRLTTLD